MKKTWMMLVAGAAICAFSTGSRADDATAASHKAMAPGEIKWGDAPPVLQKGAKMAVLYGDPSKDGLFIVRLQLPAHYKIMPHTHPTDEQVTVISGAFAIGMGDKLDEKTTKAMPAGSFFSMPAKMHHFAFSTKETIIQVEAMGPFVLNYINPADDPSKAAPASK